MANEWTNPYVLGDVDPYAEFIKQYNMPGYGLNPYQEWLQSQYRPMYASYLGTYAGGPGGNNPEWKDWLSNVNMGGGQDAFRNVRSAARNVFNRTIGMNPQDQGAWLEDIQGMTGLQDLLRSALRGKYPGPVAQSMAGRLSGLQSQWSKETGAGQKGPTFLDYIRQKYGL